MSNASPRRWHSTIDRSQNTSSIDLESEKTLADLEFTVETDQSTHATGVFCRARPVSWGPSPVDRARELIESSPRSRLSHRRAGNSRQSTGCTRQTKSRSSSRHTSASRRSSTEVATYRADSRQNSDGSRRHRETRNTIVSQALQFNESLFGIGIHVSRPSSVTSYAGMGGSASGRILVHQTEVLSATDHSIPHKRPNDSLAAYPNPMHADNDTTPPSRPITRSTSSQSPRPVVLRERGTKRRRVGTRGIHFHYANYSSETIYPNIVSAAGLECGSPFSSSTGLPSPPTMSQYPQLDPEISCPGTQALPGQFPSRSSTGHFPLATALDGMRSPSLAVVDGFGTEDAQPDVERFAPVQQNTESWKPAWDVFPLKVYRGCNMKVVEIQRNWDDEELLRELGAA